MSSAARCSNCGEGTFQEPSTPCSSCEWLNRAQAGVTVNLVCSDPDGVFRRAREENRKKKRRWQASVAPRRDFPKSLLQPNCWSCGSVRFLQLDHWDNDRSNNSATNARTLCAPCHERKSDLYRQETDPENNGFLEWVAEQILARGAQQFRLDQESVLSHKVYMTVCSKPRFPHRWEYCQEEIDMYQGYCPWCPVMSSPLKQITLEYRTERCQAVYSATW